MQNSKFKKIIQNLKVKKQKGFTLLELLITLAIFAILMVTTTSLLFMNLTAARKIKARSYVREEGAFMLNVLKKDIRNASFVSLNNNTLTIKYTESGNPSESCYVWSQGVSDSRIYRKDCSDPNKISYATPSDIEFTGWILGALNSSTSNYVIKVSFSAWTVGMPEDAAGNKDYVKKETIISTRNFQF